MINKIKESREAIAQICRDLKVRRLEVFGSAAVGEFNSRRSDIDFVVEFEEPEAPPGLLTRYLRLSEELEKVLGTKVDLITPQSMRNPYFCKSVNQTKEYVYG